MSKIICDVCGTSYPETATQCPICGCVRTADSQKVTSRSRKDNGEGYTHVKGGRFSKSNVRKRNQGSGVVSVNVVKDKRAAKQNAEKNSNRGLVATMIVLLLAIVAVVLYITIRYFVPGFIAQDPTPSVQTDADQTVATVPCEGLELDLMQVTLEEAGATQVIKATVKPADTTDEIEFVCADETVALVKADGNQATITAVATGKTMIIVKCGDMKATCAVDSIPEKPEEEESTGYTIPEGVKLELNRSDMTLTRVGETWDISKGEIPVGEITWTSKNANVATVENGVVKAVGSGMTTIYAECGDQKVSCIVRCNFGGGSGGSTSVPGSGGAITEDG